MATITTNIGTVKVRIEGSMTDGWELIYLPDLDVMSKPFDLRSTLSCPDMRTLLIAAQSQILDYASTYAPFTVEVYVAAYGGYVDQGTFTDCADAIAYADDIATESSPAFVLDCDRDVFWSSN